MTPLVIYTALIGTQTKDRLRQPHWIGGSEKLRFICFTDLPIQRGGRWEIRKADTRVADSPRRVARHYKLLPHRYLPDAEQWLWMDACMVLRRSPWEIVKGVGNADVAAFCHPARRCVYRELDACIRHNKDNRAVMEQQIDQLRFLGYPPDNGLAETACLWRRNVDRVHTLNEYWWQFVGTQSVRDQLSFDFVCWRLGIPYVHIPGARLNSPYFQIYRH
jgi:Protein of unknown function (DUF616)